jgi:hypothetical protein
VANRLLVVSNLRRGRREVLFELKLLPMMFFKVAKSNDAFDLSMTDGIICCVDDAVAEYRGSKIYLMMSPSRRQLPS